MIVGTIAYMSPEQASGKTLDARSDMFSFGVVLYEMLAGHRPFKAATNLELLQQVIHGAPAPLSDDIPEPLRVLVAKALEKDPAKRYSSMRELVTALRRAQRPSGQQPAAPVRRSRKWLAVAGFAAIVIVAAAGGLAFWSRHVSSTARLEYTPLTNFTDSAVSPTLSPDGRMLAFIRGASTFQGPGDVYVKLLPDGEPVRLTQDGAEKVGPVNFSPDGSRIAYALVHNGEPYLVRSGSGRRAGADVGQCERSKLDRYWRTTIPRDVLGTHRRRYSHGNLHRYREPGGTANRIPAGGCERDGSPVVSFAGWKIGPGGGDERERLVALPDGALRWKLIRPPCRARTCPVYRCSLVAGRKMDVFRGEHGRRISHLAPTFPEWQTRTGDFGRDGRAGDLVRPRRKVVCYFSRRKPEHFVGSRFRARAPNYVRRIFLSSFVLRRHEAPVLFATLQGEQPVCERRIMGNGTGNRQEQRLLPDFLMEHYDVSPDGKQVIFITADGSGRAPLWIGAIDGSSSPRRMSDQDCIRALFAPNGEIFFVGGHSGDMFLQRIQADGTGLHKIIPDRAVFLYAISPDGKWVAAWVGADVNVYSSEGGPATRVCTGCGSGGAENRGVTPPLINWSRDGKALYLFSERTFDTYSVPLQHGQILPTLPAAGLDLSSVEKSLSGVRRMAHDEPS